MKDRHIEVLDHGYVKFIEERIIEAARMSTDGAFRGWGMAACPRCGWCYDSLRAHAKSTCESCGFSGLKFEDGDEKLLRYLYEHKHSTPFEMAGMVIEVQAPIFVFRQWHRHRTQPLIRSCISSGKGKTEGATSTRCESRMCGRSGSLPFAALDLSGRPMRCSSASGFKACRYDA